MEVVFDGSNILFLDFKGKETLSLIPDGGMWRAVIARGCANAVDDEPLTLERLFSMISGEEILEALEGAIDYRETH